MKLSKFKKSNILVSLYVDSYGIKNEKDLNNCIYSITKQHKKVDLIVFYNDLSQEELTKLETILNKPVLKILKTNEEGVIETQEINVEDGESINCKLIKTQIENFSQLFNLGFNYAYSNEYEFYSIIEQEDTVAINWFDYAEKYAQEEEEKSIFLPIIRNTKDGIFQATINEACWVEGMSEEAGVTDINLLLKFNAINPLGCVCRVLAISEVSEKNEEGLFLPMKESFKISHSYEFFLRMAYEDLKIKTVPRVGYELKFCDKDTFDNITIKIPQNLHLLQPEKGGMNQEEIKFFIDLAKQEYFFSEDRKIEFNI